MKPKVYLETTIVSYLTARPSRDLIAAANQKVTRDWWDKRREEVDLYVSQVVIREVSAGDPEAAAERLRLLRDVPLLVATEAAQSLALELYERLALPVRAAADAAHIALATVHGMDLLLTWNVTHMANAMLRRKIEVTCARSGYALPVICNPLQLLGEEMPDDI